MFRLFLLTYKQFVLSKWTKSQRASVLKSPKQRNEGNEYRNQIFNPVIRDNFKEMSYSESGHGFGCTSFRNDNKSVTLILDWIIIFSNSLYNHWHQHFQKQLLVTISLSRSGRQVRANIFWHVQITADIYLIASQRLLSLEEKLKASVSPSRRLKEDKS